MMATGGAFTLSGAMVRGYPYPPPVVWVSASTEGPTRGALGGSSPMGGSSQSRFMSPASARRFENLRSSSNTAVLRKTCASRKEIHQTGAHRDAPWEPENFRRSPLRTRASP